jgi:DNA-directed RNA polymerase subunit M/transcription elongation factor TFIIS
MFASCGCSVEYDRALLELIGENYDLLQKIAYNLHANSAYLVTRYTAAELVTLTDDMLAEHSPVEVAKKQRLAAHRQYEALVTMGFAETSLTEAYLKCRFCGHGGITFTTKQTRSADEGSTVFAACSNSKCQKRWKM